MNRGMSGFLRDNIEAFAVAIAMALVIRHYCLEAFRIPTASMNPTLLGKHLGPDGERLHGDRILVDKFVYLRREPRRFEVIVFRYPLNADINFIKRLGGLPGEWLRIVDGDIWTSRDEGASWTIQRKPPGTRDQMLFRYYPVPAHHPLVFLRMPVWRTGPGWSVDRETQRFDVDADSAMGDTELVFDRHVLPYDEVDTGNDSNPPYVGDVRVSCDVSVRRAGSLTVRLTEHARRHRLVLGPAGSYAVVAREDRDYRFPLDVRIEEGQRFRLSFANVDDTLVIDLKGDLDLHREIEFPDQPDQPPMPSMFRDDGYRTNEIALVANGLGGTLTDLRIDRDEYYDVGGNPLRIWKIPEDCFLALGDNTISSLDSRRWRVAEAHLKNGEVVRWDANTREGVLNPPARRPPGPGDPEIVVQADVDGRVRRFRRSEVERWVPDAPYPFVPRDHLVGRAFAIFWPLYLPPINRGPTRVDLIR